MIPHSNFIFFKMLLWGIVASLLVSCQNPDSIYYFDEVAAADGIIKGKDISNKIPLKIKNFHSVQLVLNPETQEICTAARLVDDVYLLAAHCLSKQVDELIVVDFYSKKKLKNFKSVVAYSHKNSFSDKSYKMAKDLAIFSLNRKMSLIESVEFFNNLPIFLQRIKTPYDISFVNSLVKEFPENNEFYFILGFGKQSSDDNTQPRLRIGTFSIAQIKFNEQENYYSADQSIGSGICFGDSGGPLYYFKNKKIQLVGIAKQVLQSPQSIDSCFGEGRWTNILPTNKN